ncbi:hypothetical protein [Vibrio alfacsensis]|uniref:hypothetical protein n=1 Tax=Vibrio alfacsensis TaxID=1074311 RepID=UPI0040681C6A
MKSRINIYTIISVVSAIAFGFSGTVNAESNNDVSCSGAYTVQIDNTPQKPLASKPNALWFQGHVTLDRDLVSCVRHIEISAKSGWQHVLNGPKGKVTSTVLNEQKKSLSRNASGNFILPVRGSQRVAFWIHVPQGKVMDSGFYKGDFEFIANGDLTPERSHFQSLDYTLPAFVRARIEAPNNAWISVTGTNVSVDMGNLTKQNTRKIDVYILSNATVRLEVDSTNNGYLVNTQKSSHRIPYSTFLQGQKLELDTPMILNTRKGKQSRFNLAFQNKAVPGATAGQYEDEMTISLIAY